MEQTRLVEGEATEQVLVTAIAPQIPPANVPLPYASDNAYYLANQGSQHSYNLISVADQSTVECVPTSQVPMSSVAMSHELSTRPIEESSSQALDESLQEDLKPHVKVACDCSSPCLTMCVRKCRRTFWEDVGHCTALMFGVFGACVVLVVVILCDEPSGSVLSGDASRGVKIALKAIVALGSVAFAVAFVAFVLFPWRRTRFISHCPYLLSFVLCLSLCIVWFTNYPTCIKKTWKEQLVCSIYTCNDYYYYDYYDYYGYYYHDCYWGYSNSTDCDDDDLYWDWYRATDHKKTRECKEYRIAPSVLGPVACFMFGCAFLVGQLIKTVRK